MGTMAANKSTRMDQALTKWNEACDLASRAAQAAYEQQPGASWAAYEKAKLAAFARRDAWIALRDEAVPS